MNKIVDGIVKLEREYGDGNHSFELREGILDLTMAAKAEEREAILSLVEKSEDWDLGDIKDKGHEYVVQSVQTRMFLALSEAICARS